MKLEQALAMLAWTTAVASGYTVGGGPSFYGYCGPTSTYRNGVNCRPQSSSFFSEESAARRQQQSQDFVDQAFNAMADELRKEAQRSGGKFNPDIIRKQEELVEKVIELAKDMGASKRETDEWRNFANKGFSFMKDAVAGAYVPNSEIYQLEDRVELVIDLPGVKRENIDLSLSEANQQQQKFGEGSRWRGNDRETLKVSGFRVVKKPTSSSPKSQDESDAVVDDDESDKIPFSKSFPIVSKNLDTESINASFENGVLTIRIPRLAPPPPPPEVDDDDDASSSNKRRRDVSPFSERETIAAEGEGCSIRFVTAIRCSLHHD